MNIPYPGLRPFRKEESTIFKGRQEHIEKLYDTLTNNRFVAVVGASGCGKSSLVAAGLLPKLDNTWRVAKFPPGNSPIKAITRALLDKDAIGEERAGIDNSEEYLYAKLKSSSSGIVESFQKTPLPEGTKLLIVVDQFEEIFRSLRYSNDNEVRAFVYLLIESIEQKEIPLYILITMRSDFIGECASFYNLAELVGDNIFLTPRLTSSQYREIISLPAKIFSAIVEPPLVTKLINDMASNQDQLPVLQHALMRMWFKFAKDSRKFTIDDYKKIGTLKGSLSKHANEVYHKLEMEQQHTASILFKCLVEHSKNHGDMRRTVSLEEAAKVAMVDIQEVEKVVKEFSKKNRNFLTFSKNNEKLIDITHESLIRQWDQLIQWKDEEKEAASTYFEIIKKSKNNEYLRGFTLAYALDWENKTIPNKYWAERYNNDLTENEDSVNYEDIIKFIKDSKKNEEDESSKQERQRKIIRVLSISISVIVIFVLIGFMWILNENNKRKSILLSNITLPFLQRASLQAKTNNLKQARNIINETIELRDYIPNDRLLAINLIEWYINYLSSEPLEKFSIDFGRQVFPESSVATSDGNYLFVGTNNGEIIKYDLFKKNILLKIKAHELPVKKLALHPENRWIVSSSKKGLIKFWSFDGININQWNNNNNNNKDKDKGDSDIEQNGETYSVDIQTKAGIQNKILTKTLKYPENNISFNMELSPDGKYIAYGYNSIMIKHTDEQAKSLVEEPLYPQYTIDHIVFTSNSSHIAIASLNVVYIKKLKINKDGICDNEIKPAFRMKDEIIALSFHPTDTLLSVTTSNKTNIFDYSHEKYRYEIPTVKSDISWAEFDYKGNLLSTTLDKKILIQNTDNSIIKVFQDHEHEIVDVIKCNNNSYLSIDRSGIINKWDLYSNIKKFSEQIIYENEPSSVKISPDASRCLIGFSSGNLIMKNLKTYETLWEYKTSHNIIGVSYSPDSKWIAHINSSNILTIRKASDGKIKHKETLEQTPSHCVFSPDSNYVAVAFDKGIFCIYNRLNNRIQYFPSIQDIDARESFISIEYNNDGNSLMTCSNNGLIKIWKSPTWKKSKEISVSYDSINFSIFRGANNQQLICGGKDQQLYLINDENEVSFLSHEKEVIKAFFFPGNQQLLSVGNDRILRVFDFPSNTELFNLKLPVEKYNYPVKDLDHCCINNECVVAVALKDKIVFYKF
ncbi:repeat-containing protein [Candidatus Magnetomorum sp. HK-1]|nr:repeat-containing protein [Candidatus Magnetomorum sp. HK-1]